jgi:hypothetical protein
MTTNVPSFNPLQWELRGYTNPYLSTEQKTGVDLVETRVNGQLDWVAQLSGWSGPNYWGNLPETVSQKRQLLGGSFGVYNSFLVGEVYEVREWDNVVVIDPIEGVGVGTRVFLGLNEYTVATASEEEGRYALGFADLTADFLTDLQGNLPLLFDVPAARPEPFYRPKVGASGDADFLVRAVNGALELYPSYDTTYSLPYKFDNLITGSTYYFNQAVFLSYTTAFTEDVPSFYDPDRKLWYLSVPDSLTPTQTEPTAFLVWNYSDPTVQTNVVKQVTLRRWSDPSDWGSAGVLKNFTGVWGDKGGPLPFNFCFDSLGVHGYSERDSLYLAPVERSVDFDQLLNYVYAQRVTTSPSTPGAPVEGDLWWNTFTGSLSVWYEDVNDCSPWVEVDYRQEPNPFSNISITYPDVATFQAAAPTILKGLVVKIEDTTGLDVSDNVLGLQGLLTGGGSVTMYRQTSAVYWTSIEYTYPDEASFDADALLLPFEVPVRVFDGTGVSPSVTLKTSTTSGSPTVVVSNPNRKVQAGMNVTGFNVPALTTVVSVSGNTITLSNNVSASGTNEVLRFYTNGANYDVSNLNITISQKVVAVLTKVGSNTNWVISPDSLLKYIANTSLYNPGDGEMWWDYSNPDENTRSAAVSYQGTWANVNYHPQGSIPPATLDYTTLYVYCDGVLLSDGVAYSTSDYTFSYTVNPATGKFDFSYTANSPGGKLNLPAVTISDILTTAYTRDISALVFSGIQYYFSPNVYDSETPLRLWKDQALQVVETLDHLAEENYPNGLLADQNTGPGPENWQRYFVRLPPSYSRNETNWQKTNLICQDFAYWGTSIEPELMSCPPESQTPKIYEQLFLYGDEVGIDTFVYSEPHLFSDVGYFNFSQTGDFVNSGVFPVFDAPFDEFVEADLVDYDPLHSRQANTISRTGAGYGDWEGIYVNTDPCQTITGFLVNDLRDKVVTRVAAPVWDASIYKFPPTCSVEPDTYSADANNYKIGYAYFAADMGAAEDGFFDVQQEAAWRYPINLPKTGYQVPG